MANFDVFIDIALGQAPFGNIWNYPSMFVRKKYY
jgi:hypothetical protein